MIAVDDTVLVLLAAGQSRRYGDRDKLGEELLGRPLGLHAVTALEGVAFKARVAIVDRDTIDYAAHGFECIRNDDPGIGMARSMRLGVARARELGAAAVLVVLADMPRITATHIHRLFDAADKPGAVVASSDGTTPCPPALFGRDRFDELIAIEDGDQGARDLIRGGRHVIAAASELVDIDTPDDLDRLRDLIRGGARRSD